MKYTALRFISVLILSSTAMAESKITVGYFSTANQENFDKYVKPLFDEFKSKCNTCELANLTPYDDKGSYDPSKLVEKLKSIPSEITFLYFDWNKKMFDADRPLIALLNEKIAAGQLVLAPTGQAANGEAGTPLSGTVMGQTKDAVIIGETIGRERLLPQSYFGPEMLTAIYAPKEHDDKGVGPLYFAGKWAASWNKRAPKEWLDHFKTKKMKSRKIFLDANDLVGR